MIQRNNMPHYLEQGVATPCSGNVTRHRPESSKEYKYDFGGETDSLR